MRKAGALLVAAILGGCGGEQDSLNKAGAGAGEPRVLTMATRDLALFDSPGLGEFVRSVERRSEGRLKIRLVLHQDVVASPSGPVGRFDLGWEGEGFSYVPAWDIPFLPFLVDSQALQRRLFEGDYDEVLADALEDTPLESLAVLPGELAHPWRVDQPLLRASDWKGARVLSGFPQSAIRRKALRAVGVEEISASDYPSPAKLRRGAFEVTEWLTLGLQSNLIGLYGVSGTVNVGSFTRPIAIVGQRKRLSRLSERERGWLRAAGADATRVALAQVGRRDVQDLAVNCRTTRLRAAVAPEAEVAALRERVRPVYEAHPDPRFRELHAMVERARREVAAAPVEVPEECRGPVPELPAPARNRNPRVLDGKYRYVVEVDDYRRAGMADEVIARDYAGVWTVRLRNGHARWVRRIAENALSEEQQQGESPYRIEGDRISFVAKVHPPMMFRFRRTSRGIRFEPEHPQDWYNGAHFAQEWVRTG